MKVLITVTVTAIIDITETKGTAAIVTQHQKDQTAALIVNPEQPSQVPTAEEVKDYRAIAKMYALDAALIKAKKECEDVGQPVVNQNQGEA